MKHQDKPAFFMAFASLCMAFSRTMDEALVELYWRALHTAPIEKVQAAMNDAIMDEEFMPPPAKLRARAGIAKKRSLKEEADNAFLRVAQAAKHVGAYHAIDFHDARIHATVREMGGWSNICRASEMEFKTWIRKKFIATYKDIVRSKNNLSTQHTKPLIGACNSASRAVIFSDAASSTSLERIAP